MRKGFLLAVAVFIVVVFLASVLLLQNSSSEASPSEKSPPETSSPETSPPDLFVVPEVPLGTIAVLLATFAAALIKGRKS